MLLVGLLLYRWVVERPVLASGETIPMCLWCFCKTFISGDATSSSARAAFIMSCPTPLKPLIDTLFSSVTLKSVPLSELVLLMQLIGRRLPWSMVVISRERRG